MALRDKEMVCIVHDIVPGSMGREWDNGTLKIQQWLEPQELSGVKGQSTLVSCFSLCFSAKNAPETIVVDKPYSMIIDSHHSSGEQEKFTLAPCSHMCFSLKSVIETIVDNFCW